MLEIVFLVLAVERVEALRGDAEGIGDRDADAAGADIETKHAVGRLRHEGIIEAGTWLSAAASVAAHGFAVGVYVFVVVFERAGEAVVALGVGDEIEVFRRGRMHGGFEGTASGITDRPWR